MEDTSHGSARPLVAPIVAPRVHNFSGPGRAPRAYRGCTVTRPRRGTARTRSRRRLTTPVAPAHLLRQLVDEANGRAPAAIHLDLGDDAYAGVACWLAGEQRWARVAVPVAYYSHYDTKVRPVMPGNPISLRALVRVAEARARYADWGTGRNSRPTNERLAADTGYSVRTVQRADTALRLLGLATEVLRGRQRTRTERFASWRVGDRHRGWASVWALHDVRITLLSPHPHKGSLLDSLLPFSSRKVISGGAGGHSAHTKSGASRPASTRQARRGRSPGAAPPREAYLLACAWLRDSRTPRWARRHSPRGWAPALAALAAHRWTGDDINQLLTDWQGAGGHWLPAHPHKPIGLVRSIISWHLAHNSLDDRPAAAETARIDAERQQRAQQRAAMQAELAESRRAREAGRRARGGPGHTQAFAELARVRRRSADRRAAAAAEDAARREAAVRAARGLPAEPE